MPGEVGGGWGSTTRFRERPPRQGSMSRRRGTANITPYPHSLSLRILCESQGGGGGGTALLRARPETLVHAVLSPRKAMCSQNGYSDATCAIISSTGSRSGPPLPRAMNTTSRTARIVENSIVTTVVTAFNSCAEQTLTPYSVSKMIVAPQIAEPSANTSPTLGGEPSLHIRSVPATAVAAIAHAVLDMRRPKKQRAKIGTNLTFRSRMKGGGIKSTTPAARGETCSNLQLGSLCL